MKSEELGKVRPCSQEPLRGFHELLVILRLHIGPNIHGLGDGQLRISVPKVKVKVTAAQFSLS